MSLELLVRIAARLRALSESEFASLRRLIETGEEDELLPAVADALADCTDISDAFQRAPDLRLVS